MFPKDLRVGDLLLVKDKTEHYYRHIMVASHIDISEKAFRVIHWRGVGEPFSVTESMLSSAEKFHGLNFELECFRLNDSEKIPYVMKTLRHWIHWGVPYDENRFKKATASSLQFFQIKANPEDESFNLKAPATMESLEQHRQMLENLFLERGSDLWKYAARREISPVRPKKEGHQTGFHCLQGILLAFQLSYVQNEVKPISNHWISNKYNLKTQNPSFESVPRYSDDMLASIPLSFKVYAKLCAIDTFRHAMLLDVNSITPLGLVSLLPEQEMKNEQDFINKSSQDIKSNNDTIRNQLLERIAIVRPG